MNMEAGVEFLAAMLMPPEIDLLRDSLEPQEVERDIEYLAMIRLAQPEDAIAFPTVAGLTIIIHNEGLKALFAPTEKCKNCKAQQESSAIMAPVTDLNQFDPLMHIISKDEKFH
jgi:hypothetical protein